MFNKKPFAVVYLDRNSFTYYTEATASMTFTYPSASVRELDLVQEDLFKQEVTQFLQSNKISPATVMFILSPEIVYEKEILDEIATTESNKSSEHHINGSPAGENVKTADVNSQNKQTQIPEQIKNIQQADPDINLISPQEQKTIMLEERTRKIQAFIEVVPLEEVASKVYKFEKGIRIVATNKKLYEALIHVFTKQLFIVEAVVPYSLIGKDLISGTGMSQESAKNILRKFDIVKQNSLLVENSFALSPAASELHGIKMTTKVTSGREYILIGLFICLLLALGVISYFSFFVPTKERKIAAINKVVEPTPILPTLMPTATPVATSAAEISPETLKILLTGGTVSQSNLLKESLQSNGYKNIITKPGSNPSTGKVLVIFSSSLPVTLKEQILQQLRQSVLNVTAQETASPEADVIVNL